jgi:hypothetical protein
MGGVVAPTWSGWRKKHKTSVREVDLRIKTWSWNLPYTNCANNIRKSLFNTLGNSTSYPARTLSETGLIWDTKLIQACVISGLQNIVDDKIYSYLHILKMETTKSSEISVINYQYARHNITQDFNLHYSMLFPTERNWGRTSLRLYHLFLPIFFREVTLFLPPSLTNNQHLLKKCPEHNSQKQHNLGLAITPAQMRSFSFGERHLGQRERTLHAKQNF